MRLQNLLDKIQLSFLKTLVLQNESVGAYVAISSAVQKQSLGTDADICAQVVLCFEPYFSDN